MGLYNISSIYIFKHVGLSINKEELLDVFFSQIGLGNIFGFISLLPHNGLTSPRSSIELLIVMGDQGFEVGTHRSLS